MYVRTNVTKAIYRTLVGNLELQTLNQQIHMNIVRTVMIILCLKKVLTTFLDNLKFLFQKSHKHLPSIYWLPKLHTNSTKTWCIITDPICPLKPLPKFITVAFKLFLNQKSSYSKPYSYCSSASSSFCTILISLHQLLSMNIIVKINSFQRFLKNWLFLF